MPHTSQNNTNSPPLEFSKRLRIFLDANGFTRATLASELGVTPITLYRWETGSTRPSPLAAEKLRNIGFGPVNPDETNESSIPRLKIHPKNEKPVAAAAKLREAGWLSLKAQTGQINALVAPFVRNGPPDQAIFQRRMLELQSSSSTLSALELSKRLSMVEEVENVGPTAQHSLEHPRPSALSWNSNYGTHGWHRYVGRFPPHVVRALLNHFGADSNSIVCDPFAGSGTTAVECRLLGIPFVGIEICPLSILMTRTKAAFPDNQEALVKLVPNFAAFYAQKWSEFESENGTSPAHAQVFGRTGNLIPPFANVERWFTPEALLGASITVEFGMSLSGFERDAVLLALSAKMRSIGNVDVDVVRAEYSKKPRENVDVCHLVARQLKKMAADISASLKTHTDLIGPASDVTLHEGSVLDLDLGPESIDHVITSPPYGVEAISYLRTHLLSYRSLIAHLGHDPYDTRDKTIGSEYLTKTNDTAGQRSQAASPTCRRFFTDAKTNDSPKYQTRHAAMMQFCDDMLTVGEKLARWMKDDGKAAFIIGNKRLGDEVIPMDVIVTELFDACDLELTESIRHKLKTNNSNSQVPWQERVIQEESILLFKRRRRAA